MGLLIAIGIIILTSAIIYFTSKRFAVSSSKIGDYLKIPRSVKGATFDAIPSSLPELFVVLYSIFFFKQFEVGIGTIAGSALFNLLVIPGICVFVAPVAFKVSKKVISRDGLFYMISVFVLVILLIYFKTWGLGVALVLLLLYLVYIKEIISHTKKHRKKHKLVKIKEIKLTKEIIIALLLIFIIGIATFFLTQSAINLANLLSIPPIIIAFTVIAAATSVPDTIISVVNAKKGNITDATSNVFGSNIFDISVGIGLPLLIYFIYKGAVQIAFTNLEIIFGLLGSTMIVLYFFGDNRELNKKHAGFLLFLYLFFVGYVIFLST